MCKSPYIHERKIVINHTTDRVGSGGDALQMLTSVVTERSSDRRRLRDLRLTRTALTNNNVIYSSESNYLIM